MTQIKWITPIKIENRAKKLPHQSKFLSLGSCFADNLSILFNTSKIHASVNPCGISYNIHSVSRQIELAITEQKLMSDELSVVNDLWCHHDFHGSFNSTNAQKTLIQINNSLIDLKNQLENTDVLIMTLGTSHVHTLDDKIVNNCHKKPNNLFGQRILSIDENVAVLEKIFDLVKKINPKTTFILTVSPVRHIRLGLLENSVSKSTLRMACHQASLGDSNVNYFPSYEIMMDELRDYRFYARDLIHPSEQAIEYIHSKFLPYIFDEAALESISKVSKFHKSYHHRPLHIDSQEYALLQKSLLAKIDFLKTDYPYLDFEKERKEIQERISSL